MITIEMLESWRHAKVIMAQNPNIDAEVAIAFQEMFIEAKALRKDNLHLLNMQDVLDKMSEYIRISQDEFFTTEVLDELAEDIRKSCRAKNIYSELCRND